MADLVERLREEVTVGSGQVTPLRFETAAELERLRRSVAEMQGHSFFCQDSEGALRRWYSPEVPRSELGGWN